MQRRKTSGTVPWTRVLRNFSYDGVSYSSHGTHGSDVPVAWWTNVGGEWSQIDEEQYQQALAARRAEVGDVSRTNEFTGTKESIVSQHNWMMAEATADKTEVEAKMRAEAAIFYRRLAQVVKEHPEEIVRQATDRASLAATQYAPFQREAKVAYFDAVTHHAKVDGIKVAFEVEAAPEVEVVEVVGSVKVAGESVEVSAIPDCDICKSEGTTTPAYADARLAALGGMWANVCQMHFDAFGGSLGTGSGQAYVKAASAPGEDPDFDATMYEWGYEVGQKIRNGEDVPNGGVVSGQEDSDLPFPRGVRDGKAGNPKAMTAKASIKTSARIDTLRDIVDSHRGGKAPQSDKVDGVKVDPQTANMLVTLYDALGDGAKAKFDQIELMKLINFGWSKVSSAKTAEWGERNFGRSLFDEDDYDEDDEDEDVEQIARDILAENGETNPHPALLADTINEVKYQMQNSAAFRNLAQAALMERRAMNKIQPDGTVISDCPYCDWTSSPQPDVATAMQEASDHASTCPNRAEHYDGLSQASRKHGEAFVPTHMYEANPVRVVGGGGDGGQSVTIVHEDGFKEWVPKEYLEPLSTSASARTAKWDGWESESDGSFSKDLRGGGSAKVFPQGDEFGWITFGEWNMPKANGTASSLEEAKKAAERGRTASRKHADVPNYIKDLDGDEAYEVGREDGKDAERVSEPYAEGFSDEVEGKPNDAEYWRNHSSRKVAAFAPTHTYDGIPVRLVAVGGSVVPSALIEFEDGTSDWAPPADLIPLDAQRV